MKPFTLYTFLACVVAVTAQSSPGVPYDVGNYFPVVYNNSVTIQPGMLFNYYQTASQPSFYPASNATIDQPFVVIMIDPDVVINASTGIKSIFLHMMQPNLYSNGNSNHNLTFNGTGTNASSVIGASYISPQPPMDPPHNYNFFLFEQPANFTMPPNFTRFNQPTDLLARAYFNITEFASKSGLGQPIAANYLRVINGTVAMVSAYATQTATSGVAFPSSFSFSSPSAVAGTGTSTTARSSSSPTTSTTSSTSASFKHSINSSQAFFVVAVWIAIAASSSIL